MADITIGDYTYRTGKMPAMQQLHVARRLAPIIAKSETGLPGMAQALSEMADTDVDYIVGRCLSVVARKQGDAWIPIWNKQGNIPQFGDIPLPELMQLTYLVLEDNLGGFMPAQGLPGLAANTTTAPSVPSPSSQ